MRGPGCPIASFKTGVGHQVDRSAPAEGRTFAHVQPVAAGTGDALPIGGESVRTDRAGGRDFRACGKAVGVKAAGRAIGRAEAVDSIGIVVDLLPRRQPRQRHSKRTRAAAGVRHFVVGRRRRAGGVPNDAALCHRRPAAEGHIARGIGLRRVGRSARRRRCRADRRGRPRRRVGRHPGRIVAVALGVKVIIVLRPGGKPGVAGRRAGPLVQAVVAAVGGPLAIARPLGDRWRRGAGGPENNRVLGNPRRAARPGQIDLARAGRRCRLAARIIERAAREIGR